MQETIPPSAYKPILNKLMSQCAYLLQSKYLEAADLYDILKNTEKSLGVIASQENDYTSKNIEEMIADAIRQIKFHRNMGGSLIGIPSGYTELDRALGGFRKGDLTIIAARPGMGKTNFGLSLARNASLHFKKSVAIFSLDLFAFEVAFRLIAMETGIDRRKLSKGEITEQELEDLPEKMSMLSQSKIHIDDNPRMMFYELRAKCQKLVAECWTELVIIDCLQLMDTPKIAKRDKNPKDLSSITASLKTLAKELDISIIVISELENQAEKRGGTKKPILLDLREYGPIERDADRVMFIYRPEYYKITEDEDGNPTTGLAEIIIAKNVHGAVEKVKLKYEGRDFGFENWKEGN